MHCEIIEETRCNVFLLERLPSKKSFYVNLKRFMEKLSTFLDFYRRSICNTKIAVGRFLTITVSERLMLNQNLHAFMVSNRLTYKTLF